MEALADLIMGVCLIGFGIASLTYCYCVLTGKE